jgi:hypothetical protein
LESRLASGHGFHAVLQDDQKAGIENEATRLLTSTSESRLALLVEEVSPRFRFRRSCPRGERPEQIGQASAVAGLFLC